MFFYKLSKLFKLKKWELALGSIQMSLIVSVVSPFFLLFLWSEDFLNRDKIQMFLASFIFSSFNLLTIYLVSGYYMDWNAIFCIFVGVLINFLIYLIPAFLFLIYCDWNDIILTQDEIREAKLNKVFRKLF